MNLVTMNGHIIPGTPIAVDFWKKRECPSAKFFFLSHLHGDHTVGLSSSWQYNIYCSKITSKLLIQKYGIRDDLIYVLETGSSHIVYLDDEKQEQMAVSVIDANHCPGSVMFLFEGYFGKVLYTGDFRYCDAMFNDTPLSNCTDIDVLYLDNTYCSPECTFPSREVATEEILSLIEKHPDHRILIGLRNLGKEDLLVKIAQRTKEWISVSSSLYNNAEMLGLPNVFCVDDMDCKIRVVPVHSINRTNALSLNDYEPTLMILPSALYTGLSASPYGDMSCIKIVPYSDHSSFEEICTFVEKVKPKFIQPIVNERVRGGIFGKMADRSNLRCLDKYLSNEPTLKFTIPLSVKKLMSLPMTTYMMKVSKQKKQGMKLFLMKKKPRASLGVTFDSPQKGGTNSDNEISAQEFELQLENMRRSFKPAPKCSRKIVQNMETKVNVSGVEDLKEEKANIAFTDKKNAFDKNKKANSEFQCKNERAQIHVIELKADNSSNNTKECPIHRCENDSGNKDNLCSSKFEDKNSSLNHSLSDGEDIELCSSPSEDEQDSHKDGSQSLSKATSGSTICVKGQTKLDSWFKTTQKSTKSLKLSKSFQHTNNKTSCKVQTLQNICKTSEDQTSNSKHTCMSSSERVSLVPLKPMNIKRSASLSSELSLFPLTCLRIKEQKRKSEESYIVQSFKKSKTIL